MNSGGSTNGITMPSPSAQAALINQTYINVGLDPLKDRCQYFECHGTGTQAGDPVEDQAIRDVFFPEDTTETDTAVLFRGSIKTIIGHLESCAGLAGILKASLAIQNEAIPSNTHFNNLNPKVEPFYKKLEVPTTLIPWPETNFGPRRAIANSFGFGGTNAHVIWENYDASEVPTVTQSSISSFSEVIGIDSMDHAPTEKRYIGPFVFSTRSSESLAMWLKHLLKYLRDDSSLDPDSLSSSLQTKRTVSPYRIAIPTVSGLNKLLQKLEDLINNLGPSMTRLAVIATD